MMTTIQPSDARFFLQHRDIAEQRYPIVGLANQGANAILQGPIAKISIAIEDDGHTQYGYLLEDKDGEKATVEAVREWWAEINNEG